jgi:hypothetical protein
MAVADGIAVAPSLEGLVAVDTGTGRSIWNADVGEWSDLADVAASNGRCFFGGGDVIDAFDLRTGQRLWSWSFGQNGYSTPRVEWLVVAGEVVVADFSDLVVGLDPTTGGERWRTPGPLVQVSTRWLGVVGDLIVGYGADDGSAGAVFVLDPASGVVRWSLSQPNWNTATRPLGADGLVYISADGVRAFDLATGAQRWSIDDRDSTYYKPIAARGRDVYFEHVSSLNEIHAFTLR